VDIKGLPGAAGSKGDNKGEEVDEKYRRVTVVGVA
jgi:hypothetical protein